VNNSGHIVIVEDEDMLRLAITNLFTSCQYHVTSFACAAGVVEFINNSLFHPEGEVDVIISDIVLPYSDGLTLMQQMPSRKNLGKILISNRSTPADRVKGLSVGVDDYICKPLDSRELLLRTQSLQKRLTQYPDANNKDHISFLNFTLDTEQRILSHNKRFVELGYIEQDLLLFLLGKQGKICRREEISKALGNEHSYSQGRALDILVSRLRKKIATIHNENILITCRGKGYLLLASS